MNQEMKPAEQLRSAARLIERALTQLDLNERPCKDCGTRLFDNREHGKINEALVNVPERLRANADRLDELDGKPKTKDIRRDGRRLG